MPPLSENFSTGPSSLKVKGGITLSSGFQKYPYKRDVFLKNSEIWLKGKREDDGVYPYWRVHNKLYDLTDFITSHPGGKFWIEATRGTDITESFESSHFGNYPEHILKKYFVKDITTLRNSPFTFRENGFFRTLKRKVTPILKEHGTGPTSEMTFIQDSVFYGFLFFLVVAALLNSVPLAVISSIFLTLAALVSHNFFHQKDNWRMYILDMMLLSSREWRISHVLSHHNFPNTIYDYEITAFEPHLEILSKSKKNFMQRYGVIVTIYVLYAIGFYVDILKRIMLVFQGEIKLRWENCLPILQLLVIIALNGSPKQGLWLWFAIHTFSNLLFLIIGLTAAHHHPEIYSEGDAPVEDKDWGLHQIVSTRERGEVVSSLFLVAITFGNHTLHHIFPTVDHSKLPLLVTPFLETCKEFGIKFEVFTIWQLFKGFFQQMATIKPNPSYPKCIQ